VWGVIKNETEEARRFADICKLQHHIVKITWEDYEKYAPLCMKKKTLQFIQLNQ
jgi:hypothetical protein